MYNSVKICTRMRMWLVVWKNQHILSSVKSKVIGEFLPTYVLTVQLTCLTKNLNLLINLTSLLYF